MQGTLTIEWLEGEDPNEILGLAFDSIDDDR